MGYHSFFANDRTLSQSYEGQVRTGSGSVEVGVCEQLWELRLSLRGGDKFRDFYVFLTF